MMEEAGFHTALSELLQLRTEEARPRFDLVLKELIAQREKAIIAANVIQQQEVFQSRLEVDREQAQARQEMLLKKLIEQQDAHRQDREHVVGTRR